MILKISTKDQNFLTAMRISFEGIPLAPFWETAPKEPELKTDDGEAAEILIDEWIDAYNDLEVMYKALWARHVREMSEAKAAHAIDLNIHSKRSDRYLLACAIACAALCLLIWRR